METSVIQIELKDGRIFRVFCANSTQRKTVGQDFYNLKEKAKRISVVTNGIHTAKQWKEIIKTL